MLPQVGRGHRLHGGEDDVVDAGQQHEEDPAGQPQRVPVGQVFQIDSTVPTCQIFFTLVQKQFIKPVSYSEFQLKHVYPMYHQISGKMPTNLPDDLIT